MVGKVAYPGRGYAKKIPRGVQIPSTRFVSHHAVLAQIDRDQREITHVTYDILTDV